MKKLLYLSLLGAVLFVQPVSGSDNYRGEPIVDAAPAAEPATELLPHQVRQVLDRVRPASVQPAVHTLEDRHEGHYMQLARASHTVFVGHTPVHARPSQVAEPEPEPAHWTLLPAALLLIVFIIRRRTAVR